MENHSIEERIRQIAADVAAETEVEFVHAEVAGTKRNLTVRIFIDKPAGVNIEDCSIYSKRIETVLDGDDFIPTAYLLEVSSPGLERGLYSIGDFEKFIGEKAKVKTDAAINGQKVFIGRIAAIEENEIVFDDKTNGAVRIPHAAVSKANLRVDLEKEFKKKRS
ncbi:MAG: ribosome maturation factor RimP [Saprospiraceae bacterium]|nr:ribosome maturation factor RimP [Pyrinomonadaceae bacterium]